jgi:predicted dehydrogenase
MNASPRRTFLKQAGLGAVTLSLSQSAALSQTQSKIVLGVIGVGGMGGGHLRLLAGREDTEIAYVCDVDEERLATAVKAAQSISGRSPKALKDLRQLLDDRDVDAVFIATPDHWHAPAAILALNAGKHVYVEKPCSHNIREGRLLTDAAQQTGKVLQVGTQSRSTEFVREAIQRIHEGEIGEVLVAKAWNSQRRGTIGKTPPSEPPAHLDFDQWVGPAPKTPYRSNLLHAVWRWWRDFGCGDIGNDGVHDIDVALWGLGVTTHPSTVSCLGGKYFFDDDQQFPDTQYAVFEYPVEGVPRGRKKQFIFEQRIWSPYVQDGYENGAAFYGTNGVMILGHTAGWRLYGPRNKLLAEQSGSADLAAHHQNFLDCIRSGQKETNAPAIAGHRAATCVHLANIAARVERVLHFDPQLEQITNDAEAAAFVRRTYRDDHWATPHGV